MTKKTHVINVAVERERQNKSAVKAVRSEAKRASEIAKNTSAYEPQRKGKPNWTKPQKN